MPPATLDAMADWIDADGVAEESGGEDAFYRAQSVPRLAANAPVLRVAELGVVKGATPRRLAALLPYLSALPAGTPVNVNTAPREVLAAIVGNAGGESLEALLADRAASRSPPSPSSGRACRKAQRSRAMSRYRSRAATST